jgi:hypothetical protein
LSFDDLFGLLLFVVFIALPALSRMTGKRRGGGASPTPGAPATGRTTTASTRPSASAPGGGGATAVPANDELERRLAEARERVRQAVEGQGRASNAPTAGSGSGPAARPPAAAPRPAAQRPPASAPGSQAQRPRGKFVSADRDDGLLSTPLDPAAIGMLGPKRAPAPVRTTRFAEAPALQVERPGSGLAARSGRVPGTFATDPDTIRNAIVWHQVLGEPRARRPLGGRPSTLRSR